jgi:hypothetical protein
MTHCFLTWIKVLPETENLILVCQVRRVGGRPEVEGLDRSGRRTEVILGATRRRKVGIRTRNLRDLRRYLQEKSLFKFKKTIFWNGENWDSKQYLVNKTNTKSSINNSLL